MDGLTWVEPGTAPTGIFAPPGSAITGGASFTADGVNFGNSNTVEYQAPNNSMVLGQPNDGYNYIIHALGNGEKYNTSDWYLVDIEFDETFGDGASIDAFGVIGASGYIGIPHAGTQSAFTEFGVVDPNGVGVSRGNGSNHHIGLIPVTRTEYGNTQTVLRAIYQIAGDSKAVQQGHATYPDVFRLLNVRITNGIKIDKIIVKKLNQGGDWIDWLNTNGTQVADWSYLSGALNNPYAPQHAFNKRRIYHYGGNLCWEVPGGQTSGIQAVNDYHW